MIKKLFILLFILSCTSKLTAQVNTLDFKNNKLILMITEDESMSIDENYSSVREVYNKENIRILRLLPYFVYPYGLIKIDKGNESMIIELENCWLGYSIVLKNLEFKRGYYKLDMLNEQIVHYYEYLPNDIMSKIKGMTFKNIIENVPINFHFKVIPKIAIEELRMWNFIDLKNLSESYENFIIPEDLKEQYNMIRKYD